MGTCFTHFKELLFMESSVMYISDSQQVFNLIQYENQTFHLNERGCPGLKTPSVFYYLACNLKN